MAKKSKENTSNIEQNQGEGKASKLLSVLIGIVAVMLCLGVLAIGVKLDIGGVGSEVLYPIFKDVPVLNLVLPTVADGQSSTNTYPYNNLDDAMKYIAELEAKVTKLEEDKLTEITTRTELEKEVKILKTYRDQQESFIERVNEFDYNVVFHEKAPEIEEYKTYYEGIQAENAEEIYRQVIEQMQVDVTTKEQAERYAKMEPAKAATILEQMSNDMDLVVKILGTMKTKESAAIMQEMTPAYSAKITKKMSSAE